MVMDATQTQQPSPQSVGREFVRQYYTLLNKAPNHLHRFYNNHSSFIHGESTLVVGQKNIFNRIQQLNFHDCHAKISQVDAQATLGNGVVVQVTGELSNDGQPMRRFTQTFVLAAQSPKKYYVHNDIFRYQDIYSDEENENESRSENGDHDQMNTSATGSVDQQSLDPVQAQLPPAQVVSSGGVLPQQQQQQQQPVAVTTPQQTIYYSMPAGGRAVPVLAATAAPQAPAVQLGAQFNSAAGTGAPNMPPQQPIQTGVQTQLNGVAAHDEILPSMQQQQVVNVSPQSIVTGGSPVQAAAGLQITGIVAQPPTAAVTSVAAAGAPSVGGIPGYQQSSLLQQQQMIQQPQQQQQQIQATGSAGSVAIAHQPQSILSSSPTGGSAGPISTQPPSVIDMNDDGSIAGNADGGASRTSPSSVSSYPSKGLVDQNANTAPIVEDFKSIHEQQQQEKYEAARQQQQQQNEPKTYANLFKSSSSSPSGFVNAALQQQQQVQQQQSNSSYQSSATIPSATFTQSSSTICSYNRNVDNSASVRLDNNNLGGPLPQRNNSNRMGKDFDTRRTSNSQQFGDNQQLFLGNIPHHATEDDLKAIFSRFGTVLELRILSKQGGKMQPGVRNPLNYGFITYDDPDSVQNCLQHGSIYFPENSSDGQKLNIEEKKPRMRSNDMPPRQSLGGGGGSNMNSMGGVGNQRNMSGGPQSRSGSNSGGMMRGNAGTNVSNNMSRGAGSGGGPRLGGNTGYNRNGSSNGGGSQIRGNNNSQAAGGGSYAGRR